MVITLSTNTTRLLSNDFSLVRLASGIHRLVIVNDNVKGVAAAGFHRDELFVGCSIVEPVSYTHLNPHRHICIKGSCIFSAVSFSQPYNIDFTVQENGSKVAKHPDAEHAAGKNCTLCTFVDVYKRQVFQNPKSQFFNVDTDSELAFACENLGYPQEDILKESPSSK